MATSAESYRLKKMAALAGGVDSIVDIGCSQCPNPWLRAPQVVGIDISQGVLPNNYSSFFHGSVEDYIKQESQRYECMVLGEIIEHVEDPIRFLKTCRRLLNSGGRLVLSTPNPNSPIERLLTLTLSRKLFYTEEHVFIFPQRWLIRLLEITGFEEICLYSGGFPVPGIGLIAFPRAYCYQTIAVARRKA